MRDITTIGSCMGCGARAVLDDSVCAPCLSSPNRGRRWAALSQRCRVDREFAALAYARIDSEEGRAIFRQMYGNPFAST